MKKMRALAGVGKRLFAAVLTLCLVLTMLPAMELTTAAAATAAPQVSYSIGTAYKYTAASGSKALPYGTASPSGSTAVSSLSGNVLTLGTTASTSSTSTNFKLIYVPVTVTVTVPANTELYLKHNIEAVANRVVGKNTATVTATSAVYYLGQTDVSSGLTFYPYYDGGASRDGADTRELATAYQGKSSTTQTRFTLDANKTIGYQNDTAQAKEFTDYFGVMIVIQRASSVENTMTAEVSFTAQTLHGHDGAAFETPWVVEGGAVSGSGNYYLSSDMIATGNISINSGVTAKLCLNGHTLDMGQYSLVNNGTLLICDCGGGGVTGTVPSTSASPKGTVSNNGTLTMTGGHISNTGDASGQSNFAIVNNGTAAVAAITGGKVTSAGEGIYNYGSSYAATGPALTLGGTLEVESAHIAIRNAYGTVRVDGGTYTSTNSYGISSSGSESFTAVMTVTGGNITGTTGISNNTYADLTVSGDTTILGTSLYGVSNSSRFTFLGGSITSTGSGSGVDNSCTGKAVFVMKGGSVLSERYRGVNNYGGTVEISGGTVTSTSNNGVHNSTYTSGSTTYLATVTVTGGTITGKRGIYNADSQAVVNMEGGKATGASSQGIYNGGLLYISGSPQITGATADIYKSNEAAIYAHSSDGTAAPYTGDKLSIAPNNAQEGDVVVNNITDGNKNKFSVVNAGYTLKQDGDDLLLAVKPSHTHTGVTGEFEEWTATSGKVSTSGKYYLADNITATGNITIASGAEVTLCLNGYTLDLGSKKITVSSGASLSICDCSEGETGVIKSTHRADLDSSDSYSDTAGAINVFGNVTLSSGTVQNDCQYGRAIYVGSNANLTVSGGKVAITNVGHYAVYVGNNTRSGTGPAGTFIMTGGVIDTGTGYGSGTGVYIHNGAVATVTGGKIQSGGGSQAIINIDSTLIIGGAAVINSTGEYSAIWLNANGSSATAVLHISGGTITATEKAAVGIAGGNGDTVAYLSGNPTITGKDSDISTYVEMDGTIKPKFYAVSKDGNTAYSGEALRLYLDGAHRAQSGEVVVRNSTDTEKFTLTNDGCKLEQSGENLAIATYGYSLWVGGVYVTEDNASDILGNGTASYNAETQTLYLENAVISGSYTPEDLDFAAGIYSSHALNIVISGTVDILVQSSNYGIGILVDGDLNIAKGPDNSSVTLNVIGDFAAAGCLDGGNITYDGLTVKGSAEIDTQNAPTEEVALSDGIFFAGLDIAKMLQFTYTAPHTHDGVTGEFEEWTATSGKVSTSGNYYLTDDITATGVITIATDAEVNLCLNGHVLNLNGTYIGVNSGATLNICDCDTSTQHNFTVGSSGLWTLDEENGTETLTGGVITGGFATYGGAFYNLGTVNLYGGNLAGNNAVSEGGGVYNSGTNSNFTMTGGTITGNTATSGGGVFINSSVTFNMSGGSISGNKASSSGGGVYIYSSSSSSSTFNMSGGTITGNTATNGGGVRTYGSKSTFNMSGGTITGNTATNGGGVYNESSATFTLSGTVDISGNTLSDGSTVNNVCLTSGKFITIGDDGVKTPEGKPIGVTTKAIPGAGSPVVISSTNETDYSKYFTSDNSNYRIIYDSNDNKLKLVLSHTHAWSTDWTSNDTHHWHECENADCTVTEDSKKDGYGEHTALADDGNCLTGAVCSTCQYVFIAAAERHEYGPGGKCTNAGCEAIDSEPFDIFVQVEGIYKPYTLSVTHTMTVAQLKAAIASTAALNNAKIASLTHSGREMKDSDLLSVYALQKASTLQALLSHSHDGIIYDSPWTASQGMAPGSDKWYLVEDLTATGDITFGNGVDAGTVYFCLNGKTLDLGEHRLFVAEKTTVHLCDCAAGGKITGDYFYNKYSPINNNGTLTVSGGTYESVTPIINNYGNLEISGGTFINTNNSYAVWHTGGDFYLYGNPTLNGADPGADIYMFQKDAKIYAKKGAAQYTGGTVSIAINKNFVAAGDTIVYGTTDTGRFTAFDTGYKLKKDGANLILDELHNHDGVTYNVEFAQGAQMSGTIGTDMSIVLTGDCTGVDLVIGSGVTVNLCLNGHTLDLGGTYITNNGSLHTCDCAGGGKLTGKNSTTGTIFNNGTLTVKSGAVENSSAGYAVVNADSGSLNISGTANISGTGAVRNEKGRVEITGGTVSGSTGYGVFNVNTGSVAVSGGKVVGGTYGIYNSSTGAVTVSGGTVTGERYYGIYNNRTGSITVSGGTVSGDYGLYNNSGTVSISGGTVSSANNNGVVSLGAVYLSGSPNITGNDAKGDISIGESGKLYAHAKGDAAEGYTGGALTVKIPSTFTDGVVVYGVSDAAAGKFSLVEGAAQTLVRVGDRLIVDSIAPAGEIVIGTERWSTFTGDISFDLFFTQAQSVSITANDSFGVKEIAYYLAAQEMTKDQLAALAKSAWTVDDAFSIKPNNKYVIYAKLTDNAGNVAYISTEGIVLDSVTPALSGIENGKTYCGAVEATVSDTYFDKVTVGGIEAAVADGKFTVSPASGPQEIIAYDKAGNTTTYTITVNNGHTYTYGESTADTIVEKCQHCDFSASAQIKKPAGPLVYNGSAHDATVVYTGTLSGGNTLAISYGTAANTAAAGSYTASITFGGATASVSYTVDKATPNMGQVQVTAPGNIYFNTQLGSIVLGGADPTVPGSLTLDADQILQVGTRDYTWTFTPNDTANYNKVTGKVSVTVEKIKLDVSGISWDTTGFPATYDGTKKTVALTGTLPAGVSVETSGNTGVNADDYTATATFALAEGYSAGVYEIVGAVDNKVTANWSILPKMVTPVIAVADGSVYDGTEKRPAVTAYDGDRPLPASEYTVAYSNNINAGTATVTVTDVAGGNYTVNGTEHFTVGKASFTAQVEQVGTLVYNSAQQEAAVEATQNGVQGSQTVTYRYGLTENACTSAAVPAFKDAGTYTVYFVASAPNHGDAKGSFTVTVLPKTLTASDFAQYGGQLQKVYDGTKAGPAGDILVHAARGLEGADLSPQVTVLSAVFDSPDAGSRTLSISIAGNSEGNYVWSEGTVQASAQILPKAVIAPQVLLSAQSLVYTGAELKPTVTVKDGDLEILSSEYVVVYTDNIAAGTATVTVTNRQGGNYTLSAAANFTILKADPDITWPEDLSGREHSPLSTVTLPEGFAWDDPAAAIGYGNNSYPMTYTPGDTDNYNVLHSDVPLLGLDEVAPVISGIENGAVIYGDGVFTVADDHLASVTVDGTPLTADADGKYTIPADNGEHTVEATDESGNRTAYTLKIYKIYTVVLKVDGKTVSTQQVGYGKNAALYAIPAKVGHDQTAPYWNHSGKNITADRVITAVYTPNTYTVTYIADGEVVETVKVTYGGSATAPAIPEKEGYTQAAPVWDAQANAVTEDMTVTAQYTVNKYTVTYQDENGVYRTLTYNHGEKVELIPAPVKEGYTVTWDTTVDEITGDVTVNAVYTEVAPEPAPEAEEECCSWWWILIGIAAAAIFFFILLLWKRKKKEEEQAA